MAPWAATALTLAVAWWAGAGHRRAITWVSLPVITYGVLVALNTLAVSPAYTPAGLYYPLILAMAFVVARSLTESAEKSVAQIALAVGLAVAAWGLVQVGALGVARAQANFETPAIYAAFLNLLLVPALIVASLGKQSTARMAIGLLLASGVFAADSRGGLLALVAGLGVAAILAERSRLLRARSIGIALVVLAVGWVAATGLRTVAAPTAEIAPSASERAESSISRLELYALSWEAWRERPLTGTGYLTFRYTLEQGRAKVPSYGQANETWFVHSDYLQALQELGPAGLLAFLALTVLPPILTYRRLPPLAEGQRLPAIALAAALTSMSVHALVDFPFYVPACLLLYGVWLGMLERRLGGSPLLPDWTPSNWYRVARVGALALGSVIIFRPLLAEASAEWGLRKSSAGASESAAVWLGAAQRLDPAEWRYHWYAGQFWDLQASQTGNREAARLAAEAYAAGFAANSLEVRNLLGKIAVHRRYRALLDSPADVHTLEGWRAQAGTLAPFHPAVRREMGR